jgi:hypothetical protein
VPLWQEHLGKEIIRPTESHKPDETRQSRRTSNRFQGVKEERLGGDDDIRPAFPDSPAALAPYGWSAYRLHQQLIRLRRRHAWL